MLTLGAIYSPGYKIALFFHIAAVVALGPTFAYGVLFSVLPKYPRSAPALIAGMRKIDRVMVNPAMIILLIAGIVVLASSGSVWKGSQFFVIWGFIAIIALFGIQHGFFAPKMAELQEIADRDAAAGDTLSAEFGERSQLIAQVGAATGILIVLTVFFMVYKPFFVIDASLPVAMFDSGVGGLTVLHECLVALPQEDYVYLGDTAMFPYGERDPAELRRRIAVIAEKLLDRGAKLLVIACNTATAIGEGVAREVAAEYGVEVVPVVAPQAEIAAAITDNGRVGVLATTNTVESGAYRRALEAEGRGLDVIEVAAPRLAPFIQEGSLFDEETMEMARGYCAPLREAGIDTLILGCTHFPLVAPMLQRILGRNVRLVSGGHAVAAAIQRTLERSGLAREGDEEGTYEFFSTGPVSSFGEVATRFLQMPLGEVRQVEFTLSA